MRSTDSATAVPARMTASESFGPRCGTSGNSPPTPRLRARWFRR